MKKRWNIFLTSLAAVVFPVSLIVKIFPSEFFPGIFLGMGWSKGSAFRLSFFLTAVIVCAFCFSAYWLIHVAKDKKILAIVTRLAEGNSLEHHDEHLPISLLGRVKLVLLRIISKGVRFLSHWRITTWLFRQMVWLINFLRTRGVWLFCLALVLSGFFPATMMIGLVLIIVTGCLWRLPFLLLGIAGKLWLVTFVSSNIFIAVKTIFHYVF